MQQIAAVKTEKGQALTKTTGLDGLESLTMRLGDAKAFRNPDSLRSVLQNLGEPAEARRQLQAIIDGPPQATTLDFAEILSRLALHYWRPDFKPGETQLLNADYIKDLRGITRQELIDACRDWRTDALNRFYPRTAELLELVRPKLSERARMKIGAAFLLTLLDEPEDAAGGRGGAVAQQLHDLAERMRAK